MWRVVATQSGWLLNLHQGIHTCTLYMCICTWLQYHMTIMWQYGHPLLSCIFTKGLLAAEGSGGSISPCFYLMMNVLSMTGQVLMYLACSNSQSLKHWAANNNILLALSLLKSFSALKSLGGRGGQYWTVLLCKLLVSSPGSPIIFQSTQALKKLNHTFQCSMLKSFSSCNI